ncbi:tripartite motif protein trim9 [Clonorchis sinensis]|uniref:Tripartite motif protein trim9 n=1 Tax=Clonorchis sinensis TaxID=79923 RepID=G7YHE5_CLOSI|nr:tripartite motif protein trim9 [Clonorchis sinensis]
MLSGKLKEEVHCPGCQQIFRNPLLLPCGHSVCVECANRLWFPMSWAGKQCPVSNGDDAVSEADSGVVICSTESTGSLNHTTTISTISPRECCPSCSTIPKLPAENFIERYPTAQDWWPRNVALENLIYRLSEVNSNGNKELNNRPQPKYFANVICVKPNQPVSLRFLIAKTVILHTVLAVSPNGILTRCLQDSVESKVAFQSNCCLDKTTVLTTMSNGYSTPQVQCWASTNGPASFGLPNSSHSGHVICSAIVQAKRCKFIRTATKFRQRYDDGIVHKFSPVLTGNNILDVDRVIPTAPGWLLTDVSGVRAVSFYPVCLNECLEM